MKHFSIFALGLAAMLGFASCSDDNDDVDIKDVPQAYKAALAEKFPDAVNVKWEKNGQYYVADFSKPQTEYDVWFAPEAKWAMTEADYGKNLFMLPPEVEEAFSKGEYGFEHTVEDVEMYERTDLTFYVIEVEPVSGDADIHIFYNPDGTVIKTVTGDVSITPDTVL